MAAGFILMVVGMAVVFAFLGLMVGCMQLSAAFFERFAHMFPDSSAATGISSKEEPNELVALSIAVAARRARE